MRLCGGKAIFPVCSHRLTNGIRIRCMGFAAKRIIVDTSTQGNASTTPNHKRLMLMANFPRFCDSARQDVAQTPMADSIFSNISFLVFRKAAHLPDDSLPKRPQQSERNASNLRS